MGGRERFAKCPTEDQHGTGQDTERSKPGWPLAHRPALAAAVPLRVPLVSTTTHIMHRTWAIPRSVYSTPGLSRMSCPDGGC
jgi:hypothetical protein